jgi:hypothetical protein
MTFVDLAVFVSIAAGVVCWALGEARRSRLWWIHSIAAFSLFYGWSHETARRLTAQQTAALTGVDFAGGIYVNYLFLSVWLADAAWWWASPGTYAQRPRALSLSIRGFIFFIIINGAVIFADGLARLVGVVCVAIVLLAWTARRFQVTN